MRQLGSWHDRGALLDVLAAIKRCQRQTSNELACPCATVARIGGAAFLIGYGVLAGLRAARPSCLTPSEAVPERIASVVLTCLALTFLNPHVYLDTVVLLGALADEHRDGRWLFGVGAVAASAVWFTTLGFGARRLKGLFATPTAWRVLDGLIAVTMLAIAVALLD